VNAGSSLKFCLVAAGEADIYPRFGPTMEWDTAAGHAVLAAAGGRVLTCDGSPLSYGKPEYRNPYFIAASPTARYTIPATSAGHVSLRAGWTNSGRARTEQSRMTTLTHLQRLEAESIHIMREVAPKPTIR
jgi:hypothetical protein